MRGALLGLALAIGACSDPVGGAKDAGALPYATLSAYGFFKGTGATQEPVDGVEPYLVNASLFADFADKHRFVALPPGGKITYAADDRWVFPVGTKLIKSFGYGGKLVETRVLIHTEDGWLPTTYLWNDAQTEATLLLTGAVKDVSYTDEQGQTKSLGYRVPNQNQCFGCHGQRGFTDVLGLRTRQMNRTYPYASGAANQIDHLAGRGLFASAPPPAADRAALADPYGAGPLEGRARAWLEANCAHCHSPGGAAGVTNLYLMESVTKPIDFGVCRPPNAAGDGAGGNKFDVVPGDPAHSVLAFRIASTVAGVKMPEMPIQLVDQKGVDLIAQWIAAMPAQACGNQ